MHACANKQICANWTFRESPGTSLVVKVKGQSCQLSTSLRRTRLLSSLFQLQYYTTPHPQFKFKHSRPCLAFPPAALPCCYLFSQVELLQAMKFIDDICEGIVSPPKLRYSPYDLGSAFSPQGRRHDFQVLNPRGLRIQASFYQHTRRERTCVVYLHSMNGSRLESTAYADFVLSMGLSFCNFDFTGCGNSEGTTISFGANEKHDILAVLDALSEKWGVQRVLLWGRSMGAASAVKYCELIQTYRSGESGKEVLGMILDSCFRSFDQLAVEIGRRHSQVPAFLVRMGYYLIRGSLEERGGFCIADLELEEVMARLGVPALFLTSSEDDTVRSEHSVALFNRCSHDRKKLAYIRGLHNEARDEDCLREVRLFIEELLVESRSRPLQRANKFQLIASERRNFSVEGSEWENGNECTCSLFPSPLREMDSLPTTRRKQSEPSLEKIKVNRIPSNRYNFRSTEQVAQVAPFELPL